MHHAPSQLSSGKVSPAVCPVSLLIYWLRLGFGRSKLTDPGELGGLLNVKRPSLSQSNLRAAASHTLRKRDAYNQETLVPSLLKSALIFHRPEIEQAQS